MSEPYVSRIDRRTTLAWLAGALAAGLAGGAIGAPAPAAKGYGTDPDLLHPTAPWPRIMTAAQLRTTALLCDFILPASADAPSATAVGVPDFIDEWVSAPYPDQTADRTIILAGLDWAETRTPNFASLTRKPSDPDLKAPHTFFRRFRSLTIGAYYTTEVGFKEIGYIGNVPMAAYPGPSDEVKVILDTRLKKMGL